MNAESIFILLISGLLSGLVAGLLGVGGGVILVPLLVALGYNPINAIATSSLCILITSVAGSLQNWKMGFLDLERVIYLGLPSFVLAQIGVLLSNLIPHYVLLGLFSILLLTNIYLIELRQNLTHHSIDDPIEIPPSDMIRGRLITGSAGGLLSGLFGVGGGVIMVPLQIILLKEKIKLAIQTSLGVIVITAVSATLGHAWNGNVLFEVGTILGIGGLVGVQISTRLMVKLPDRFLTLAFRSFLAVLSGYMFYKAMELLLPLLGLG